MSMIDAMRFAELQQQQRIAAEQARAAHQEGREAERRVRDALLAAQTAEAARDIPRPADGPVSPVPVSPIPIPDSAPLYDPRAYAQAHVQSRAGISPHSHSTGNANESQQLLRSWESDIQQMAQAASAMPSKGCAKLIRKGVKARGYTGRDSVVIERLVWQRRRELAEKRKAAHAAALDAIEAGL